MILPETFDATLWLGLIAVLKALSPYVIVRVINEPAVRPTIYDYAWATWNTANFMIWGFLGIIWPLTYFRIYILYSFYIWYYDLLGIRGGLLITLLISFMFILPAWKEDIRWAYFIVYFLVELSLLLLSNHFYDRAVLYYFPPTI